jgi:parvulin-like peptidyl-prolyl isomerase
MKECPNCKKQYEDNETYCLEDGTVLDAIENTTEAETVELSADEVETVLVKENVVKTEVLEAAETVKVEPVKTVSATASGAVEMSSSSKLGVLLAVILLAAVGLLFWKVTTGGHKSSEGLTKLTKEDMETLFQDASPQELKMLAENPEAKKNEIEGLKRVLAIAQEARATGFANQPEIKKELEQLKMGILAQSYDKEKNKDKKDLPPFSAITKEEVDAYFQKGNNAQKFDETVKEEIAQAKKAGRIPDDFEIPAEQLEKYKEGYAKMRIYADEAKEKWSELSEEFRKKTEFQIKFQQAQYLVSKYAEEVLTKKIEPTEEELKKQLAENPEEAKIFDEKRAKAEEILKRVQNGEDFAALAQEFSDDPSGKTEGGLIKNIAKGAMVKEFEKTSLALQEGQISPTLAWTKYGYHIIKLERKGMTKDKATGKDEETYDARHILISVKEDKPENPTNPMMAQAGFLRDKIDRKIMQEKQKKLLDDIVARNPIEIEDFEIKVPPMPEGQPNQPGMMPPGQNGQQLTPEQMEQRQKQIQQRQEQQQKNPPKPAGKEAPKPKGKEGK